MQSHVELTSDVSAGVSSWGLYRRICERGDIELKGGIVEFVTFLDLLSVFHLSVPFSLLHYIPVKLKLQHPPGHTPGI